MLRYHALQRRSLIALSRQRPQSVSALPFRPRLAKYSSINSSIEQPQLNRWSKKRPRVFTLLSLGVVSLTILCYTNDSFGLFVRHTRLASERIATVVVASARCFTLYRKVLNAEYSSPEEYSKAMTECHKKAAYITRKAMEKNAGVFIKLGQHIAALTYIFPDEWTTEMIPLQDKCPTSSFDSIERLISEVTGKELDELFESFDSVPLGTASLAQVHKATMKETGQEVAVKVQHPSLQEFVPLDVLMTRTVFGLIDYFFKEYPLTWLGDELQNSIYVELDFREEAKNSIKTQEYFKDFYKETALRIPDVIWAEKRVLVMEYLQGARPDDLKFLDEHHISRNELSSCLSHIFNNMIFTPGVGLHCDPHPGNMAIISKPVEKRWWLPSIVRWLFSSERHNFEIVLYDHGLYRDVPTNIRRSYAHFWLSLMDGDEAGMRHYAREFAGISDDQFKLFAAAISGRDFENATTNVVSKRTKDEIMSMTTAISEGGLLSDIMVLLHSMPRIVLLILKTNDLTRYLDEKLENPLGPERTFLIMALYCAKIVYDEEKEKIDRKYHNKLSLQRFYAELVNLWSFYRRQSQLTLYDLTMLLTHTKVPCN